MRCSSVVLPEPERPSTATSRPRVNAASKPDSTGCVAGSAAVALVDPAQLADDLAVDRGLAGGSRARLAGLAVAGERHLALVRPPARAPADAGLVARALGQAHPATAPDDEPVGAAAQQLAADAPVAHVHDAVGELRRGLVVADDHERRPAAGDHAPRAGGRRCAPCAASSSPAGSSARSSAGAWASAAQAATRCCSPPESAAGGSSARSARPMPSSSARARARRSRDRDASERQRQRDVVGAGERRGEGARVVLVEEAELLRAEGRRPACAEAHDIDAERARDAGGRPVEARGDAEQRALARSARTEHDAALAPLDRERHPLQGDGARGAVRVDAEDVAELECECPGHSAHCSPVTPRPAAPRR